MRGGVHSGPDCCRANAEKQPFTPRATLESAVNLTPLHASLWITGKRPERIHTNTGSTWKLQNNPDGGFEPVLCYPPHHSAAHANGHFHLYQFICSTSVFRAYLPSLLYYMTFTNWVHRN